MTTNEMMQKQIKAEAVITRLEFMRDNGLDMTIVKFKDFTEVDKAECVVLINERIVVLGGGA